MIRQRYIIIKLFTLCYLLNNNLCGQPLYADTSVIFSHPTNQYFTIPALPINHLMNSEMVAVPFSSQGQIIQAYVVSGELPEGTTLYPNGFVAVTQQDRIKAGKYKCMIETVNSNGERLQHLLNLNMEPPGFPDRDAVFSLNHRKHVQDYVNGEVFAYAYDFDGQIVEAVLIRGNLPPGTVLSEDGKVTVSEKQALKTGVYNACIATTDEKKGVTLFVLTLILKDPEVIAD